MQNMNVPRIDAGGLLSSADFEEHMDRHFGTRRSGAGPTLPAAQCRADACRQGRVPCPTPDACRDPDPARNDKRLRYGAGLVIGSLVSVALWLSLIVFYRLATGR